MSPRQFFGYLALARARVSAERAHALTISLLGARGEDKAVQDQLDEWIADASQD